MHTGTLHRLQNGWTMTRMIQQMIDRMPAAGRCADDYTCLYRNEDGQTCAVGAFIPDALYDPKMDYAERTHDPLRSDDAWDLVEPLMPLDRDQMRNLQEVHDRWGFSTAHASGRDRAIQWLLRNVEPASEEDLAEAREVARGVGVL